MNNHENNTDEERLAITVAAMSRKLGLGLTKSYALTKKHNFYPAKRIGGRIVIDYKLLKKWLSEQKNEKGE